VTSRSGRWRTGRPPSGPLRLVLVPGLGLDSRSWRRVLACLSKGTGAAEVVPLPGAGERAPVPSLEQLARLFRERMGPGPVVLA
jgi:pimeloyl-ACP methyl ester carboxylesterase